MLQLSKVATVFVMPLGIFLALAAAGCLFVASGRKRAGLLMITTALAGLWLASMPLTARLSLSALEAHYPVIAVDEVAGADVAIVLGGAVEGPVPPRRAPDLGDAADRVLAAAELYRAGKVRKIVVSGGNLPWGAEVEPEAETIRGLLISWGVAAQDIVTGGTSRTTAENAREVLSIWPSLDASSALLVTSAAHMTRAIATFRKAGLPVSPFPTDVRAPERPFTILDLLPDAIALKASSDAAKEALGLLVYRLRGDL